MARQRVSASPGKKQTHKRLYRTPRRNKATWQDPTVRVTKISGSRKTKPAKKDQKEGGCWWFGWE
jgi:hypothetical protein